MVGGLSQRPNLTEGPAATWDSRRSSKEEEEEQEMYMYIYRPIDTPRSLARRVRFTSGYVVIAFFDFCFVLFFLQSTLPQCKLSHESHENDTIYMGQLLKYLIGTLAGLEPTIFWFCFSKYPSS
jgi:hypothetical protein